MKHLFERWITPAIAPRAQHNTNQLHVRTFGMTESGVAEKLVSIENDFPGVTVGYRAHFPEIEVKLHARADTTDAARSLAANAADKVASILGDVVFGGREDSFAAKVGASLRAANLKLAVAESCTGGMVGQLLTAVPGSSEFLLLDAVTYANEMKERVLGVERNSLREHGAVSEPVAVQMAEGAMRVSSADIAVSITGVAGPGGGTDEKPVGTVWFALARKGEPTISKMRKLPGDRDRIRTLAAYFALQTVMRSAKGQPPFKGPHW